MMEGTTGHQGQKTQLADQGLVMVWKGAVLGVYLGGVSHNGNLHDTKTALLAWRLDPGQMRLFSVTGCCNQLAVQLLKLLGSLTEGNNLCWADKCEVLEAKAIVVNCSSNNSSNIVLCRKARLVVKDLQEKITLG